MSALEAGLGYLAVLAAVFAAATVAANKLPHHHHAGQPSARSAPPAAKPEPRRFRIAAGLVPPHVDEGGQGREVETIQLLLLGHEPCWELEFVVQPFARHWSSFVQDPRMDAVTTIPETLLEADDFANFYASDAYIHYQNGVGYRESSFPAGLSSLDDLVGRRVIAFAGAGSILRDLGEHIAQFGMYLERQDQQVQSRLLLDASVDAVVEDQMVFTVYNQRLGVPAPPNGFCFNPTFAVTPYRMFFRRSEDRDFFNAALNDPRNHLPMRAIDARYRSQYARGSSSRPCP